MLNGELLVAKNNKSLRLTAYDVDRAGLQLKLTALSDVRATNVASIDKLNFSGDLLEWRIADSYYNAVLPFNNVWQITPQKLPLTSHPSP